MEKKKSAYFKTLLLGGLLSSCFSLAVISDTASAGEVNGAYLERIQVENAYIENGWYYTGSTSYYGSDGYFIISAPQGATVSYGNKKRQTETSPDKSFAGMDKYYFQISSRTIKSGGTQVVTVKQGEDSSTFTINVEKQQKKPSYTHKETWKASYFYDPQNTSDDYYGEINIKHQSNDSSYFWAYVKDTTGLINSSGYYYDYTSNTYKFTSDLYKLAREGGVVSVGTNNTTHSSTNSYVYLELQNPNEVKITSTTQKNKYIYKNAKVKIPKRAAAPKVKIDYKNETFSTSNKQEYRISNPITGSAISSGSAISYGNWTDAVKNMTFSSVATDPTVLADGFSIQIRTKGSGKKPPSDITTLVLSSQPPVDESKITVQTTATSGTAIAITDISPSNPYEYTTEDPSLGSVKWTALRKNWTEFKQKKFSATTIYIRQAAIKESSRILGKRASNYVKWVYRDNTWQMDK